MGRKTFESLGKPLPGRKHIILTRREGYSPPAGHYAVQKLEDAFKIVLEEDQKKIYILGGAEIYTLALPLADELIVTEVHANPDADTFFPTIDDGEWTEKSRVKVDKRETSDQYDLDFVVYVRKTPLQKHQNGTPLPLS